MNIENLIKELNFKFTRSSGAGGQHVNKVSTKVVLRFDVIHSVALSEEEIEILSTRLENKISKEGILSLTSDATRSQLKNKEQVTKRFVEPTKRPKSANLKRLQKKKNRAETKANRRKPTY